MFPEQQGVKGDYQCVATLDSVGSIVSRTARLKVASKYNHILAAPVILLLCEKGAQQAAL
jgi:hypothetical protein